MSHNVTLLALGHAISGAAGTAVSTAAVFPVDLVTTRLKAQRVTPGAKCQNGLFDGLRSIVEKEGGIPALYKGLSLDVAKSVADSFLFFGFYNYLRSRSRHLGAMWELTTGAIAGACARALTTPISIIVARLQLSAQRGTLRQTLADIWNEGGILGLWSGYSATLFLISNPSLTFFVNRRLAKRILPALEKEDIPVAWAAFFLAALSKSTATALTYPFQTGRLRLQMASEPRDNAPSGDTKTKAISLAHKSLNKNIGVIFQIIRKEGRSALYDGLRAELLKGFLSHGLTMLMKGVFLRLAIRCWFLLKPQLRRRLKTQ